MKAKPTAAVALASISAFALGNLSATPAHVVPEIVAEQATKETYVQVLPDNKLPSDAKDMLQTKLPANMSVNTHSGPEGDGYSIVTKEADKTVSVGIGAYAQENTWVREHPKATSTSLFASSTKPK